MLSVSFRAVDQSTAESFRNVLIGAFDSIVIGMKDAYRNVVEVIPEKETDEVQ